MNTPPPPILFLIFNRLDTTKQVFAEIRKAAPQKLYIASDGPRENRDGEKEKVETVRKYVLENIDWKCDIKTLFRENNLGCGKAVAEAITWFFENEEMGIILEDDCLPSESFFSYCEELLLKYKDEERIMHITGNNPLTHTKSPYSYYFARIQHCWGWASWRRSWKHYSFDIKDLDEFIKNKRMNKIFTRKIDREYFINIFKQMQNHEIDTWDYQWTYTIFKNNGICINPSKNLISNIGFNKDATHTLNSNSIYNNQNRYEIDTIKHAEYIKIKPSLLIKINKYCFGLNTKKIILYYYSNLKKKIKGVIY